LLVGGGRVISVLLGLLAIRVMTTVLTPVQYGEWVLLTTVQMFCGLFLVNPIGQHINLHTHSWWDEETLVARLKPYGSYIVAVALTGSLVIVGLNHPLTNVALLWMVLASFCMIGAATWNSTLIPMLNLLGYRGESVILSTITVAIGLIASLVLVRAYPGAIAWFGGQAIGMAAGALGAWFLLRKKAGRAAARRPRLRLLDRKTLLTYCLPLSIATGLMWVQLSGYRFLVEKFWGLAELGFLAVGLQLAAQVWNLAESLAMQFLYPLFYRRISSGVADRSMHEAYSDLLNTLVPIYLLLTGILITVAPSLLKLLVSPKFHDAVIYVVLGACIELFRVLGSLLSNAAHAKRQTKSLALPYGVGSIVGLGLIYAAGALHLSLVWSAVALVVAGAATFGVMAIGMHKQIAIVPDVWRISAGALMVAVAIVLLVMYPEIPDWKGAFSMFAAGGVITCLGLYALLRNNPAMHRMLLVKLRNK
jgi:O-antigen/teichoic acid export membrane protein